MSEEFKRDSAKKSHHSVDYIAESQFATNLQTPALARISILGFFLGFLIVVLWASLTDIDTASSTAGKVVSEGSVQVIQSLIDGRVEKIHVKEGQHVKVGQVLVTLDDQRLKVQLASDEEQYAELRIRMARLYVEATSLTRKPDYPDAIAKKYPEIVQNENRVLYARRAYTLDADKTLANQYEYVKEQIAKIKPLVKQNIVSSAELIRLEKEKNAVEGERLNTSHKLFSKAREELIRTNTQFVKVSENLSKTKEQLTQTKIVSPIDGVVNNIYMNTQGGVINPAVTLMEIVPFEPVLRVETNVPPNKIGFVDIGDRAYVKLDAYDYTIYGGIPGEVTYISSDTVKNDKGEEFYEVKIKLKNDYVEYKGNKLIVRPGMSAMVNIVTEKVSVLAHVLKPFVKTISTGITQR